MRIIKQYAEQNNAHCELRAERGRGLRAGSREIECKYACTAVLRKIGEIVFHDVSEMTGGCGPGSRNCRDADFDQFYVGLFPVNHTGVDGLMLHRAVKYGIPRNNGSKMPLKSMHVSMSRTASNQLG